MPSRRRRGRPLQAAGYDGRVSAVQPTDQPALGPRLREATRVLHTEVERAGVMRRLLRGQLDAAGYCLLLRNLHAVYEVLEAALQLSTTPALQQLVPPVLWRAPALQQDLLVLHGSAWRDDLPLAPAALAYVQRLHDLAHGEEQGQPQLLAAHAYVRYLGDLNGGQMLARLVAPALQLHGVQGQGLAFYSFAGALSVIDLQTAFRQALDLQASSEDQMQVMVLEACSAFERHRELFEQLDVLLGS